MKFDDVRTVLRAHHRMQGSRAKKFALFPTRLVRVGGGGGGLRTPLYNPPGKLRVDYSAKFFIAAGES